MPLWIVTFLVPGLVTTTIRTIRDPDSAKHLRKSWIMDASTFLNAANQKGPLTVDLYTVPLERSHKLAPAGNGIGRRIHPPRMTLTPEPPSIDPAWAAMCRRLEAYREQWGNADAPVGGQGADIKLGQWCKLQRALRARGKLSSACIDTLDSLGFSWTAPSDIDDPITQADWNDMLRRLAAYRAAHGGSADVPKKYQSDAELGGWVAAVRRSRGELGDGRVVELDAAGFAWESSRQCGSAFMQKYRELRAFWQVHGHANVASVEGDAHEMAKWCVAQQKALRAGTLSPKRATYLRELGFDTSEYPASDD